MNYTRAAGMWNFGNCSWLGPGTNPVMFVALNQEKDGSYSNFVRLTPESVDDYNLDPQIFTYLSLIASPNENPKGMIFSPGGIGYAKEELTTRCAIYRTYHGGAYPPWSPAPLPPVTVGKRLKNWLKVMWS